MSVISEESYITGPSGLRMYYRHACLNDVTARKASLCIVHGFGEHSGRFVETAEKMAKSGYDVHMIDLRGFGYSGGARSAALFSELLQDVSLLLSKVDSKLPIFLLGHSMGGLLVVRYILEHPNTPLAGLIVSAPLLQLHKSRRISEWKQNLLVALGDSLKEVIISAEIEPTNLTRCDKSVLEVYHDRLCIPFMSLRLAAQIISNIRLVENNAQNLNLPILLLHGEADRITCPESTQEFYHRCGSKDKRLILYPDAFHELQHDLVKDEWVGDVISWMDQRAPTPSYGLYHPVTKGMVRRKKYSWFSLLFLVVYFVGFIRTWSRLARNQVKIPARLIGSVLWPLISLLRRLAASQ